MKKKYFNGRETVVADIRKRKTANENIIFTAYCRKLIRELMELKSLIEKDNKIQSMVLLDELISDTLSDIEN